jgi:hypothetical protein
MNPLLLAGLFTGGSVLANSLGAGQQSRAVAQTLQAERERQNRLDAEARAISEASRARYDDMGGQTDAKAASLSDLYADTAGEANANPSRPIASAPASSSNIVASAEAAEGQRVAGNAADERGRLARMRAFGDVMGGIGFDQARAGQQIGQIGGFMRGSQNVMPLEMNGAQMRGSGMRMVGDLLNMAGGVATQRALIHPDSLAALFGENYGRMAQPPRPRPANLTAGRP